MTLAKFNAWGALLNIAIVLPLFLKNIGEADNQWQWNCVLGWASAAVAWFAVVTKESKEKRV